MKTYKNIITGTEIRKNEKAFYTKRYAVYVEVGGILSYHASFRTLKEAREAAAEQSAYESSRVWTKNEKTRTLI